MNCLYREREKGRVILYNKVFVLTIYECRTDMDVSCGIYEGGREGTVVAKAWVSSQHTFLLISLWKLKICGRLKCEELTKLPLSQILYRGFFIFLLHSGFYFSTPYNYVMLYAALVLFLVANSIPIRSDTCACSGKLYVWDSSSILIHFNMASNSFRDLSSQCSSWSCVYSSIIPFFNR